MPPTHYCPLTITGFGMVLGSANYGALGRGERCAPGINTVQKLFTPCEGKTYDVDILTTVRVRHEYWDSGKYKQGLAGAALPEDHPVLHRATKVSIPDTHGLGQPLVLEERPLEAGLVRGRL